MQRYNVVAESVIMISTMLVPTQTHLLSQHLKHPCTGDGEGGGGGGQCSNVDVKCNTSPSSRQSSESVIMI